MYLHQPPVFQIRVKNDDDNADYAHAHIYPGTVERKTHICQSIQLLGPDDRINDPPGGEVQDFNGVLPCPHRRAGNGGTLEDEFRGEGVAHGDGVAFGYADAVVGRHVRYSLPMLWSIGEGTIRWETYHTTVPPKRSMSIA